jgi:hypothetical protein
LESTWNAFPTELAVEQSHHRAINFVLLWCFSFFEEIKAVNVYAISYQKTTRGSFGTFQIGLLQCFIQCFANLSYKKVTESTKCGG